MPLIDTDAKQKQIQTIVKWGFVALVAAISAPLAFTVVEGLLAWGVAAIIIAIGVNFAPVIGTYIANKRVAALVAVVEANPIETMQNLYMDKSAELEKAAGNIADFETEIRNFDDQVVGFKKEYPDEAESYDELSGKMHGALTDMKQQQTAARQELQNFQQQIHRAEAYYKMSLAAQKVIKLSKSAESQVFADIKERVAFDTVRTQLNKAFSNLNMAIERRQDSKSFLPSPEPKALPPAPEVVDMPKRAISADRS